MEIRRYESRYRNQVIALVLYLQNFEQRVDLSLEEQPDLADIPAAYQAGGGEFWVALGEGGDVVGTLGLMKKEGHWGVLKKFFVAPAYRGSAVGTANRLFAQLVARAREEGLEAIVLDTPLACRRAHGFYRKHGFVEIEKGQLPFVYEYPDRQSLLFAKRL